jgi:magnesium transporter
MTKLNRRTSVSTLMGASVMDDRGTLYGRVHEFVVAPELATSQVHALVLKRAAAKRGESPAMVLITDLKLTNRNEIQMRVGALPSELVEDVGQLMLERDLLDQQIIDVHGRKVVRVNDVDLMWESGVGGGADLSLLSLRIVEVEVGLRGAVRRLLKGLPSAAAERIAGRFRPSLIPWDFVDLIDRDPSRRVKLKIEQNRLSQMHPSDIADILEELAPAERQALFISLNEEVAAEALEEVKPKMQQALIESLNSGQIADIVEVMDPGAAADLLSELSEERSEAILGEMEPEERHEVEELLEFSGDSAAGRMTTDYIALPASARLADAIAALREFEGDLEIVTDIYLLDEEGRIDSLVSLVQLLLAVPDAPLVELPHGHVVSCDIGANGRKVAELFDKYNLRSLPVLDGEKRLVGVIHAEQVIALLRANN